MAKFKIAVAVILAVLLLVIIIQNTESVQTTLLFVTVELPRAALLFCHVDRVRARAAGRVVALGDEAIDRIAGDVQLAWFISRALRQAAHRCLVARARFRCPAT